MSCKSKWNFWLFNNYREPSYFYIVIGLNTLKLSDVTVDSNHWKSEIQASSFKTNYNNISSPIYRI